MKTKAFSVTGTGAWAWDGPTNVIYYEGGTDAGGQTARIRVRSPDGNVLDAEMKPGRQLSLPTPVAGVVIESMTGNAIIGKVSLGLGDIRDSSLLGTVEVVDGGKARSLAGSAFLVSVGLNLVAGQYPYVQLFNPAGSGKNVMLAGYSASGSAGGAGNLRRYSVQNAAATTPIQPKKLGSAFASVAEARGFTAVASLGSVLVGGFFAAQGQFGYRFTEPVVIPPGDGVIIQGTSGNDLTGSFEFHEEAV